MTLAYRLDERYVWWDASFCLGHERRLPVSATGDNPPGKTTTQDSYVGLYYPFIHFRNEGWLKLTALYWDSMRRIVPVGASVQDTDEVKRLVDAGFIQNREPLGAAFKIANPFRELIAAHGDELRAKFAVADRSRWPDDPHTALYAPGRDHKLAYVFDVKMDPQLLSDLFSVGLVESRSDDPRWIGMHPDLVKVYMIALAEAMAPRLGAHPLTDQSSNHVAVSGLTMERLASALLDLRELAVPAAADAEHEVKEAMATLALRNVVPTNPASIPAEKIIEFRKRYTEERDQFQIAVAELTGSLAYLRDVKDLQELEQHLQNEYDKKLGPKLEGLRKGLKKTNIDIVDGAMAVSVALPASLTAILTVLGVALAPPVGAAASLAFVAWTIWRKHQKAVDDLLKPSPQAYLYRVGKLSAKTVMNEIDADSRKFLLKGHRSERSPGDS
jgi:hypothetical protein